MMVSVPSRAAIQPDPATGASMISIPTFAPASAHFCTVSGKIVL